MSSEQNFNNRLNNLEASIAEQLELQRKIASGLDNFLYSLSGHQLFWLADLLDEVATKLEQHKHPTCPLVEDDGRVNILIRRGERINANNHLKAVLRDTVSLTIVDPYFLAEGGDLSSLRFRDALRETIPESVKKLKLFISAKPKKDSKCTESFKEFIHEQEIDLEAYITQEIHDRVWIKDDREGYVVGTSFNGLGMKCAFILELSSQDLRDFMRELIGIRENPVTKINL